MRQRIQAGFTLIEIAIVLLIVSLLLGGIVKGQELINSARVRSLANDISGIETAWVSFQDRYRALPGDFDKAPTHIKANSAIGNKNATVEDEAEAGGVWQHLAESGFISGSFTGAAVPALDTVDCSDDRCPSNPFNGYYKISAQNNTIDNSVGGHQLSIGGKIPVKVIYELDLKVDDGLPNSGRLRHFSSHGANCVTNDDWNVISEEADCAAVWLL